MLLDVAHRRVALQARRCASSHALRSRRSTCGRSACRISRTSPTSAHVDLDVLVDLGRVDLDVDLLGVRRVGLEVAGHAVVEAHAERDDQVGLLDRACSPRPRRACPSCPGCAAWRRGEAAEAEQRRARPGCPSCARTRAAAPVASARDDAVAGEDQRALGARRSARRRARARRAAGGAPGGSRAGAPAIVAVEARGSSAARPW